MIFPLKIPVVDEEKMVKVKGMDFIECGYFMTSPYFPIRSYSMHKNRITRWWENRKYKKRYDKEFEEGLIKYPPKRVYFSKEAVARDKAKGEI